MWPVFALRGCPLPSSAVKSFQRCKAVSSSKLLLSFSFHGPSRNSQSSLWARWPSCWRQRLGQDTPSCQPWLCHWFVALSQLSDLGLCWLPGKGQQHLIEPTTWGLVLTGVKPKLRHRCGPQTGYNCGYYHFSSCRDPILLASPLASSPLLKISLLPPDSLHSSCHLDSQTGVQEKSLETLKYRNRHSHLESQASRIWGGVWTSFNVIPGALLVPDDPNSFSTAGLLSLTQYYWYSGLENSWLSRALLVHCMIFSSMAGLYSWDASSTPHPCSDNQKCLQILSNAPWSQGVGGKSGWSHTCLEQQLYFTCRISTVPCIARGAKGLFSWIELRWVQWRISQDVNDPDTHLWLYLGGGVPIFYCRNYVFLQIAWVFHFSLRGGTS